MVPLEMHEMDNRHQLGWHHLQYYQMEDRSEASRVRVQNPVQNHAYQSKEARGLYRDVVVLTEWTYQYGCHHRPDLCGLYHLFVETIPDPLRRTLGRSGPL